MRVPVVLHTNDGIRFGVTVPDLLGCFSSGETFDDVKKWIDFFIYKKSIESQIITRRI